MSGMGRAGLLVPLLLVPLTACGAEPTYAGLADDPCARLDAVALARSSYPGTEVRADDRGEGEGSTQTRVCAVEVVDDAGRALSISVEAQTFDEAVTEEDLDRLRDLDVRTYQGSGASEVDGDTGALDGWWQEGWYSSASWTEPEQVAGFVDTAAVRDDNLLVTVLVTDRWVPAARAEDTARQHAKVVRALLGRAKGLARRG